MSPIILHMTVPPSANSIWRAVNGRVIKSKRYREWMQAGIDMSSPGRGSAIAFMGECPVAVDIQMKRPRKNSDVDNRIKPVLDKLVTYYWLADDKQVMDVRARWADVDGCIVTITPLDA